MSQSPKKQEQMKQILINTELILQYKRPRAKSAEEFVVLSEGEEAHWEVVERILFIYSKLNPGQSYVQVSSGQMYL